MIPEEFVARQLWDKYNLSEKKRIHVQLVADVALFLASSVRDHVPDVNINMNLLLVGALLHDIDKNISRLPGENHPETGVRILKEEGMHEVAELIKFHSVQNIDNPITSPKTWEEKLLFLADKMVKQDIITVDKRFALWLAETDLPEDQKVMLRRVFPLVKNLEKEIFSMIHMEPQDVAKRIKRT